MVNVEPCKVIVKQMTVSSDVSRVYSFLEGVKKSMETEKAARNVMKADDG